ncbi:MAG: GAF domain-containing protein [Anaerolineales bacterium]|nr:GAF domain-containing protein [Anaerolineales bacterium]MBX3038419.1 GAF domain-containing protein [Anaerolineales bacterium]
MMSFLNQFLDPSLSEKPLGFRRNIRLVLLTGLICTCILALLNSNRTEMLLLAGLFLVALTLNQLGYYLSASWLTLFGGLIINLFVMLQKNGIRDTSILGFIVILIFAGLIGGTKGTLSIGALLIMGTFILGYFEIQGILVNQFTPYNFWRDYYAVAFLIFLISGLQYLIISRLNKNIVIAGEEIQERKKAEEQLQQRITELEFVRDFSEIIIGKNNLTDLIEETGKHIREAFRASSIFIAIHNPQTNQIHFPYDVDNGVRMPDVPLQYGRGLTSKVMEMKKSLVINENWMHESLKYNAVYRNRKMAKSSIATPMMIQERAIGVIAIDNTEREYAFTENDVRLLETIAANFAVAIENARLQESIQQELIIQEKLVQQLEKKNEELERFTYTASHDLKAPLITIRGYLGYIEKDAKSGNYQRLLRDTQRISEATEKMHRLLNELLELSRIGRIINKAEEALFADIVQDALKRVENQIRERKVRIKVADRLGSVVVDKERMIEVVQNLVDNAIKFMGKQTDPEIEIGIKKQGNEPFYFIKDNGIGIKKEFHERIFGLFDKLDSESEGTGIGLALVKRIIEVHGGKIWVESEEGKGTAFCFTLPQSM